MVDKKLIAIIESRMFYLVLALLLIIYYRMDLKIINLPKKFELYTFATAFISLIVLLFWRYLKYKEYYRKLYTDWIYLFGILIGVILFSFILQRILKIPLNYLVKMNASNESTLICSCEIINYIDKVGKADVLMYKYEGEIYSFRYNIRDLERNDIIQNFTVEISAYSSLWGTYYIDSFSLEKK